MRTAFAAISAQKYEGDFSFVCLAAYPNIEILARHKNLIPDFSSKFGVFISYQLLLNSISERL